MCSRLWIPFLVMWTTASFFNRQVGLSGVGGLEGISHGYDRVTASERRRAVVLAGFRSMHL